MSQEKYPIGVFDSGYGGLTVLKEFINTLPEYDYIYLGDNARAPYGTRSFETIHKYTLEAVKWLFDQGCPLVILACNTASAKALRTIQQNDLPNLDPSRRVLGVIRPISECVGSYTKTNHIGVLGTSGTISSGSYPIEINKFFPNIEIVQEACPMWVPLVENNEGNKPGADFFINQHLKNLLAKDKQIDTIILGCTHYPLLLNKIKQFLPNNISIISQGEIVARSLTDYLNRHSEIEERCSKNSSITYYTTDSETLFNKQVEMFFGEEIKSKQVRY
jgi:glutamate racemase